MQPRSADEIRRLAIRWIEEGWQKGREGVVDELHAPEFVDRDPGGRPPDREGFKRGLRDLYAAFPDFEARIEDVVVDESRSEAAVRWTGAGTHRSAYLGVGPTGRRIRFKGIEILRFDGGWIVERWGEWDGLDLLAQLGAR
jgi:steroid delta-isomerase-like uncharacterized protein